jgi:hypothetical protein
VVVQIARETELLDPFVKKRQSGAALHRLAIFLTRRELVVEKRRAYPKRSPHLRTKFKPPLPIRPPQDLLRELLSDLEGMSCENRGDTFLLSDNAIANPLRKTGHLGVSWPIEVPL